MAKPAGHIADCRAQCPKQLKSKSLIPTYGVAIWRIFAHLNIVWFKNEYTTKLCKKAHFTKFVAIIVQI